MRRHRVDLLEETINRLSREDLGPEDVLFVSLLDGSKSSNWDDFAKLAIQIKYPPSNWGQIEVSRQLVVYGESFTLQRRMSGDPEGWVFRHLHPATRIDPSWSAGSHLSLEDLHEPDAWKRWWWRKRNSMEEAE